LPNSHVLRRRTPNSHHTCIKGRNKRFILISLYLKSHITCYRHCSTSDSRENREIEEQGDQLVRCLQENLPISSWCCCTQSLAHAAAATIIVVVGATTARSLHLHHHRHRLRPLHAHGCWRGPCPFPPTSQSTDKWSPRTQMPHCGVIETSRVLSTVGGPVPTGLHRRTGHHHRVIRGRRREKKKKMKPAASR
jgi:hypothetical protein